MWHIRFFSPDGNGISRLEKQGGSRSFCYREYSGQQE
jgi:hypothetical protein